MCTASGRHSCAICEAAPRARAIGPGAFAMFALRAVRGPSRPVHLRASAPPRRSFARPCQSPIQRPSGTASARSSRDAVSESTWHIWLERVSFRELDGTTLVLEAPDDVRAWVQTRFGRLLTRLRRDRARPRRARRIVAPEPRAEPPRARARGAARADRAGAQPAADVRPVRDRRLQPARPRRRARRRRDAGPGLQPALHLRPARPRQDPPAALDRQLRRRARRRADRPLHDRRGVHRPLRRRAPRRRASRPSRPPTAASTCCSSTTSSSCRARRRPSRSSSTPSTRCTRPAPSSC